MLAPSAEDIPSWQRDQRDRIEDRFRELTGLPATRAMHSCGPVDVDADGREVE